MTIDPQPTPVSDAVPVVKPAVVGAAVNEPQPLAKPIDGPHEFTHGNGWVNGSSLPVAGGESLHAPKPLQGPALDAIYNAQSGTAFATESPEWQAAREKVIAIVGTSTPTSFPGVIGAGEKNGPTTNNVAMPTETPSHGPGVPGEEAVDASTPVKRGTGRPRGRPRGSRGRPRGSRASDTVGRSSTRVHVKSGGKRKRGSDDDGADDTDDSENLTPVTTVTKSGRNVTKPPQYNPAPAESPDGDTPRKKRRYRKGSEMALCVKCQRGHSTVSNMVVFCDGCNDAFHQWCHDPLIGRDVIDIPEREWFCYICQGRRERDSLPLDQRVSGQSLTAEQKANYLRSLSSVTLADLLLRSLETHPDLPLFAPSLVRSSAPKRLKLNMTPKVNGISTPSLSTPQPQTNGHETHHANSGPQSSYVAESHDAKPLTSTPSAQQSHATAAQTPKLSSSATSPPTKPDPYPDYSNPYGDPPATYPRPGRGPIKLRSITSRDDMQVLLDENFDVFSHLYNDGKGNLVPLKGSGSRAKGSNEIVRLGAAKAAHEASTATAPTNPMPTPAAKELSSSFATSMTSSYPPLAPAKPSETPPAMTAPQKIIPPPPVPYTKPTTTPIGPKPRLLAPAPAPPNTSVNTSTNTSMAGGILAPPPPKPSIEKVAPPEKTSNGVATNGSNNPNGPPKNEDLKDEDPENKDA